MKVNQIDFPRPLLDALKDNRLVVFAGAGVSIPEPAGLPSFRQLAEEIARGSGETAGQDEAEDRFLGRLHDKGQQVHFQATQILQEKSPRPSCLHHDLTALYRNLESLRIVTTNFDTLFDDAAKERFGALPEVFQAPALPLGTDFNGIVHIHGSIHRPRNMVLTDADFGRAYLAEGWARRFLMDLFRTFPVLFVGYGHNDTVMNYLARALPVGQTQPRFALAGEAELNKWHTLRVKPVNFSQTDEHSYSGLYEGVSGLAKYVTRGVLDWQTTITEIARNPPSLDQEDMDAVGDGLSDPARTRFFTEAASHLEWVRWLDVKGHLDNLFGSGPPPMMEEATRTLGRWLAHTFAKDHSDEMFELIRKHGMNIHQDFWTILAAFASQEDTPWEAKTLARWVSVLLDTTPRQQDSWFLQWLGERCIEAGLTNSILDIFRKMSDTKTLSNEGQALTTQGTNRIQEHHGLNELWERGLKPSLDEIAEPLLEQIVDSFRTRHRALCTWQQADRDWDPDSYGRNAIEPHEQDKYAKPIDVLVNAARDSLEHLVTKQPETAANWCDRLVRSNIPILRRLAVHALDLRGDLSPNAKIDWILAKIDLHDMPAHHELFRTMKTVYHSATPEQRQSVIHKVDEFSIPEHPGKDTAGRVAYRHFTWFSWLSEADPECKLVKQGVEGILQQHPNFEPGEYPDLTHHLTVRSLQDRSPWTVEELLSKPAKEWAGRLLSFEDTDIFEPDRESRAGLARAVGKAATQDFKWCLELADILAQNDAWSSDLWPPLIGSWAHQQGEVEQQQVLNRLLQRELQHSNTRVIAETLKILVREGNLSHGSRLLSKANQVTAAAWESIDENEPLGAMEDWYWRAINHPAGMLTEFWMHSLSSWYNEQNPRPERISEEYLDFMHKVVTDQSNRGKLGKSAIARQFRFLTAVEEEWVTEHLIPLFDSENKDDRLAVWEASLYDGLSPRVAEILGKPLLQALSDINELFPPGSGSRDRFIMRFTDLATHFLDQPLEEWIPTFFANANEEDRRKFASSIGNNLQLMENGPQQDLWDRWLRKYWENRLNGTPAPMDPSEATIMLCWLPHLHELFPEAVELAVKTTNLPPNFALAIHPRDIKERAESHPEPTARLLIFLEEKGLPRHPLLGWTELTEKLLNQNLPKHLEHQLKEIRAKFGL